MITNLDFLDHAAKKRNILISTGMSNYSDIDKAVEIFKNNCEYELMHSVSTYPCPENKLNIHLIKNLKNMIVKLDIVVTNLQFTKYSSSCFWGRLIRTTHYSR